MRIGLTLNLVGELLLAYLVISVHKDVLKEGKIDRKVKKDIRREIALGCLAIILLAIGYFLQINGI